ncbi:MAG TPA: glycosyltransferase [Vicinamibacterales bacterium]|nr:glycosyltransferase [Vicinamibacterales bacterium]
MRVLLATFGSLGDLHPIIALGLELQRRGHAAAIVTSEYHRERIARTGLGFHPAAPDLRPDDKALIRATMDEARGPEEVVRFMLRALPDTYRDYERAADADGADLIVTSDLAYAGPILAQKTGLAWASQVLSPISFLSPYDETVLPPLPWLRHMRKLGPRAYGAILGLAKRAARRLSPPVNEFRRSLDLAPVRDPFFDDKHAPALVLAMFSRLIAEPRPDWPPQTVITGYAFYDGDEAEVTSELREFLDAGSPPIVFTLGSAAVFDPGRFFIESAAAAQDLGRRAVLLVGPEPGPLPASAASVGIFPYAPFSKIFPRAAAIVHQGGSGTTAQAMRSGRPMVIVPYAHDQPDNAQRVSTLGISRTVRRRRYSADSVRRALQALLDDRGVPARCASVREQLLHEYGARTAADAIERTFIRH